MIQTIDFAILDKIQELFRSDTLDVIMPLISMIGNKGIFWIIISIVLLIWKKHRLCGKMLATGLIGCLLLGNVILKNLIARARPCWINTDIDLVVNVPKDYSFPSGHTMAAFAAVAVMFKYDKRAGFITLIIAILIAFSRMYLYVHFPSDVLVGAILGIVLGLLSSAFWLKRAKK